MDIVNTIQTNFTIVLGVFVTLVVMGITTLVDIYKNKNEGKDENSLKSKGSKSSFDISDKKGNSSSKNSDIFSELRTKLRNLIPNEAGKNSSRKSETKSLKPENGINKIFSSFKDRLSLLSSSLGGKGDLNSGKSVLQSNKKTGTSKFNKDDNVSSFDIDKVVGSKKDEFDFEDDLLTEMSTASSIKSPVDSTKENNTASLDGDLTFDDSEFDLGFGEMGDDQPQEDIFNTGAEKIALSDERDNLLDSLKKNIVVKDENKIDFMTSMKGENLDVKLIKSELEDISRTLKTYRQRSNHN